MAQKSFDDKRTDRINRGMKDRKQQRKATQTLRQFSKVGSQDAEDLETYEELLDDIYDDLYDAE